MPDAQQALPAIVDEPAPQPRPSQFSLRTLLIVMLVSGPLLAPLIQHGVEYGQSLGPDQVTNLVVYLGTAVLGTILSTAYFYVTLEGWPSSGATALYRSSSGAGQARGVGVLWTALASMNLLTGLLRFSSSRPSDLGEILFHGIILGGYLGLALWHLRPASSSMSFVIWEHCVRYGTQSHRWHGLRNYELRETPDARLILRYKHSRVDIPLQPTDIEPLRAVLQKLLPDLTAAPPVSPPPAGSNPPVAAPAVIS